MGLFNFNDLEILAFFLVLMRMSAFVVTWPVFGTLLVPQPVKILFALIASIVIFPTIVWDGVRVALESHLIVWLVVREIFIGACLGFLARLFFFIVSMAGQMSSLSMGISSSQLFNPSLGSSSSSLEQTYVALATMLFLAINGHHIFIGGLVESYSMVPLSVEMLSLTSFSGLGDMLHQAMAIGVQLCAPVLVAILFMNLAMAVVGRTVPQINVLITSLPINILVGFVVILVAMPLMVWQMNDLLYDTATRLFEILKSF